METKLTPEMMETMSLKEIFEYRLNENRHEDQLPELRRLWAAMEVERKEAEQKPGWWARFIEFWRVKRQDNSGKVENQKATEQGSLHRNSAEVPELQ